MKTMREIVSRAGLSLAQTVYCEDCVLDHEMPVDRGWELKKVSMEKPTWKKIRNYKESLESGRSSAEYRKLKTELAEVPKDNKEKKAALRSEKRKLEKAIAQNAFVENFPGVNVNDDIYSVSYKSGVSAINISEITGDALKTEKNITAHPWFLSDIDWFVKIAGQIGNGENLNLGMEGGYCILGTDEMLFHVILTNNEEHIFDFNTMQELTGKEYEDISSETDTALWEFMQAQKDSIQSISIECEKSQITTDEYQQLYYLFVLADYFNAKLVVTIPDLSYEKTFLQTFGGLPSDILKPMHAEFLNHIDRLADLCIRWTEQLNSQFPEVETAIFHRRSTDFTELFNRQRSKYLDAYAKKHLTTNRDGRRDALMDYVCMPALPFYQWGTVDVIEVNRLEEYPSIEKCRRIHKGAMRLHSMLFPQEPSANRKTSCFYAARKYKKYITLNNYN